MKIPAEISYRNLEKSDAIENLVREQIAKLERFCNYMNSCRVAIEKAHDRPNSGSPYRVRIDITVPPSHELAVVRNPGEGKQYEPLEAVIRDAFEAARRQLVELVERQRDKVKTHPQQQAQALVIKLFPQGRYGFLKTADTGREIYFDDTSLVEDDFDRLEVGTGVSFTGVEGESGPRAATVHIADKPGVRSAKTDGEKVEQPLGWK
jgi:ribosome-associated translation inhibitor RaiA